MTGVDNLDMQYQNAPYEVDQIERLMFIIPWLHNIFKIVWFFFTSPPLHDEMKYELNILKPISSDRTLPDWSIKKAYIYSLSLHPDWLCQDLEWIKFTNLFEKSKFPKTETKIHVFFFHFAWPRKQPRRFLMSNDEAGIL